MSHGDIEQFHDLFINYYAVMHKDGFAIVEQHKARIRELCGHYFDLVKDRLEPSEYRAFFASLIKGERYLLKPFEVADRVNSWVVAKSNENQPAELSEYAGMIVADVRYFAGELNKREPSAEYSKISDALDECLNPPLFERFVRVFDPMEALTKLFHSRGVDESAIAAVMGLMEEKLSQIREPMGGK